MKIFLLSTNYDIYDDIMFDYHEPTIKIED